MQLPVAAVFLYYIYYNSSFYQTSRISINETRICLDTFKWGQIFSSTFVLESVLRFMRGFWLDTEKMHISCKGVYLPEHLGISVLLQISLSVLDKIKRVLSSACHRVKWGATHVLFSDHASCVHFIRGIVTILYVSPDLIPSITLTNERMQGEGHCTVHTDPIPTHCQLYAENNTPSRGCPTPTVLAQNIAWGRLVAAPGGGAWWRRRSSRIPCSCQYRKCVGNKTIHFKFQFVCLHLLD